MPPIATSYFDYIEITDRETVYLRTSWVLIKYKVVNRGKTRQVTLL